MRIVLDTNVWIAAALRGGFSEDIILIAIEYGAIVCSEDILREIGNKLKSKFHWEDVDVKNFLGNVRKISEIVSSDEQISEITRDPDDNKILECAIAGEADLIVSADQDLIKLKKFRGIAIVHPKTFSWIFPKYFKNRKT